MVRSVCIISILAGTYRESRMRLVVILTENSFTHLSVDEALNRCQTLLPINTFPDFSTALFFDDSEYDWGDVVVAI